MLLNSPFYVNFSIISLVKSISTFVKLGKLRDRLVSMLEIVHSPLLMKVKLEKRIHVNYTLQLFELKNDCGRFCSAKGSSSSWHL